MTKKIAVFIEQRSGEIKKASLQAASAAVQMAKSLNAEVVAVTCAAELTDFQRLGSAGVPALMHLHHPEFGLYSSSGYADALTPYLQEIGAEYIFFAHTAMGRDLAPKLAVRLQAGILADCIEVTATEKGVKATRPVYAGKALLETEITEKVKIVTLRPNVFPLLSNSVECIVEKKIVPEPNFGCRVIEYKKAEGKLDVAEAEIIVSGGRGLKGAEHFSLIEDLAESLGAAVGASRAVVDAGWRPHSEQVGQTGKTVSPNLYIACGISGAIQHMAGMASSKCIVAINKDKDAPIFTIADYGIIGDVFEVLPALTAEIRKLKA